MLFKLFHVLYQGSEIMESFFSISFINILLGIFISLIINALVYIVLVCNKKSYEMPFVYKISLIFYYSMWFKLIKYNLHSEVFFSCLAHGFCILLLITNDVLSLIHKFKRKKNFAFFGLILYVLMTLLAFLITSKYTFKLAKLIFSEILKFF